MEKPESISSVFYDSEGMFQVCVKNDRHVGSLGVWVGDNPFDFVLPVTLCQIIFTVIISRVLYYVLRPLKTPKFICSVLGGILLGPSFMGRNHTYLGTMFPPRQASFLVTLSKVGAVYFVFIIALKMDLTTTLRAAKRCWRFGVIPLFSSYIVISVLLIFYVPDDFHGIVAMQSLPGVFSLSSFAVISEALVELNLLTTEIGQIALSSAIINDIMQWITVALAVVSDDEMKFSVQYLTCYCAFILFGIFVVRPMTKMIVRRTPTGKSIKESYVVLILLGALVMAAISDMIGLSFLLGPTFYGLVMPNGPPLATTIIERSEVVISEFLMPFFFVYIGINTDLTEITQWRVLIIIQCILVAGFLVKVLACVLVSPTYNIRLKHGMVLGLILNMKGIIELMYFARMRKLNLIDGQTFTQMVLSLVGMTAISAPLITTLYKHHPRVVKIPSIHEGRVRSIQNTPRNSEFHIVSCVHNEGNVHSMIALLEACNPIPESPIYVYVIHLIELLGKSTPILLPLNKQNRKSLSVNYPNTNHIMRAFENYSHNSNGPVTILPYVNVAPYKNMHDAICNLAEDKMVPFLIIPFHENDQTLGSHVATSIRDLNTTFQARTPCTVGILVDRYSRLSMSNSKLSFHVGIFFMGGPDDRETLALGIRMSERANMSVTLLRFVVQNKNSGVNKDQTSKEEKDEEEEVESMLDESLIDEFKAKKFSNDNVVYHEVVVDDCIQVLQAIRGLEKDYDLVMVGKRHSIGDLTDEEMSNFMENAEQLGIFGDMLASTEFCDGKVSVLVMQCGEKRVNRLERLGSAQVSFF